MQVVADAVEMSRVPISGDELLDLLDAGGISQTSAKEVFEEMFRSGRSPKAIVEAKLKGETIAVPWADLEVLGRTPDVQFMPEAYVEYRDVFGAMKRTYWCCLAGREKRELGMWAHLVDPTGAWKDYRGSIDRMREDVWDLFFARNLRIGSPDPEKHRHGRSPDAAQPAAVTDEDEAWVSVEYGAERNVYHWREVKNWKCDELEELAGTLEPRSSFGGMCAQERDLGRTEEGLRTKLLRFLWGSYFKESRSLGDVAGTTTDANTAYVVADFRGQAKSKVYWGEVRTWPCDWVEAIARNLSPLGLWTRLCSEGRWRGKRVPEKKLRALLLATLWDQFFKDAPRDPDGFFGAHTRA